MGLAFLFDNLSHSFFLAGETNTVSVPAGVILPASHVSHLEKKGLVYADHMRFHVQAASQYTCEF